MRKHIVGCILSCMVASAYPMSAVEQADTAGYVLDDVVVSAVKAKKQAVSTAPMRVMDQDLMLRAGVTDVSQAIHRMPGVTLRDYGGAGGLKTVSVRGLGAGHTGVVIDGVPLCDAQSGQIDLAKYSIDNIESVSMVIGDNDDIFMPARLSASAAIVKLSSMPVAEQTDITAKVSVGSFGYVNPFLRVGAPINDQIIINVAGDYTYADNDYPFVLKNGTIKTRERRNNSDIKSGHGEVNLAYKPNNGTSLISKIYYYDCSRRLPGPVIYYNNENHEELAERNAMVQSQLKSSITDKVSMLAVAKFNFASSMYHDENGKYPGGVLDQNYWQREYYLSASTLYVPDGKWLFDYSVDYFYNNLNSNLRTDRRPFRNSLLQSVTAKLRLSRLSVMARALYSVYLNGAKVGEAANDAFKLSPSLSLSYQPFASQLLYLRTSYKNIFRTPTFNEAYFDHYGSQDLKPESTDQVNVGITYTTRPLAWLSAATFTVDGYVNNICDMIVAVPYNMFVWSMTNLGKVRIVGVDATAEVSAMLSRGHTIALNANYSYQRAMPRTNPQSSDWMKQVAYIPKHSGNVSLSYENPWVNLSVHAAGVSERYTTNTNLPATRIDGYIEAGATAWRSFRLPKCSVDLRLDLINMFDCQYCVVARYPMPGRSWKATVGFKI